MPLHEFPKMLDGLAPVLAKLTKDPQLTGMCVSAEPAVDPDRDDLVVTLAITSEHLYRIALPWQLEGATRVAITERISADVTFGLARLKEYACRGVGNDRG